MLLIMTGKVPLNIGGIKLMEHITPKGDARWKYKSLLKKSLINAWTADL